MKQNRQLRSWQNSWTSLASRNRSRMPQSGEYRLLLDQSGRRPHRTGERGLERTVQGLDGGSHVDIAELLAPQALKPGAGDPPSFDERSQFAVRVPCHVTGRGVRARGSIDAAFIHSSLPP